MNIFFTFFIQFRKYRLNFIQIILIEFQWFVLTLYVFYELIFSVIFWPTIICKITNVRFIFNMSSLMIVSITNSCKHFLAKLTWIRLFSSVYSLMNLKITSFIKYLVAIYSSICALVVADGLMTNKSSLNFLNISWINYLYSFIVIFHLIIPFIIIFILMASPIHIYIILIASLTIALIWSIIIFIEISLYSLLILIDKLFLSIFLIIEIQVLLKVFKRLSSISLCLSIRIKL